ncbi:Phospholipase/carboxylesterase [Cylindrobasidium torrendii FP15055 ss-10]|uniref:Acyl-protein thioesterase 1 n=1 Tax=Cylindrobasidium torrendii FP15055 ss-10 TaxID=1314674 RepID=A0A0D7BWF1_9AGAR|nr:Phospholipase/carboxylesterase [Cylindrobasidium torrendii FP15055 ss-10]
MMNGVTLDGALDNPGAPLTFLEISPTTAHTATVILLHSLGDTGQGFEDIAREFRNDPDLQHIKWILPHANFIPITANAGLHSRAWYDVMSFDCDDEQDTTSMLRNAHLLNNLISTELEATNIPSTRMVLGGFSQGAVETFVAGVYCNHRLAGFASLSGFFPMPNELKSLASQAFWDAPFFIGHGLNDRLIPVDHCDITLELLTSLGAMRSTNDWSRGITFIVYEDGRHDCPTEELDDLSRWLKAVVPSRLSS